MAIALEVTSQPFVQTAAFALFSNCPAWFEEVPRAQYERVNGELSPLRCNARVYLQFADPLERDDGRYSEPVVVVERAGDV